MIPVPVRLTFEYKKVFVPVICRYSFTYSFLARCRFYPQISVSTYFVDDPSKEVCNERNKSYNFLIKIENLLIQIFYKNLQTIFYNFYKKKMKNRLL